MKLSDFKLIPLFLILFSSPIFAQEMVWGEIPKEDLEMTVYESFPDADAVVLGDDGLTSIDFSTNKYATVIEVHRRIKILKKSAFDRADISIRYRVSGVNRLNNLKAQIISPSGKIVVLKKADIFTEKISNEIRAKKIAFPNVQEGSIIEYKYMLKQEGINIPSWSFQEDIPVRWSRYRVQTPDWFEYISMHQGRKLDVNLISSENSTVSLGPGNRVDANITKRYYEIKNVSPLKEESYITTMNDYVTKIKFQLKGVNYPNQNYKAVLSNWSALAKELRAEDFGQQYLKKSGYNKILKAAGDQISAADKPSATIEKIFDFVQKNMEWDGDYWYNPKDIEKAYEKKKGYSGQINMILLALLRNAGIKAYPALISTRRHGKVVTEYPIMSQFNHMILYTVLDGKAVFLDAINDSHPYSYLPVNSLNKEAWVLFDDAFKWMPIVANKASKSTRAKFKLSEDGDMEGMIQSRRKGYIAFGPRKKYLDKGEETFIQEGIQKAFPDADITAYTVKDAKANRSFYQDQIELSIPSYAESNGDLIYIQPMLHEAYDENPFKAGTREYPVEMPYPFSENYILELEIPEGYTVESLPESAVVSLEGNNASFKYTIGAKNDKTIQLVMRMQVVQTYFNPENYVPLKKFYDLIVEKQGEQIVLKKIQ